MMIELSPSLVDLILGAVAIEFVLLWALLVRARATRFVWPLFLFLVSGALLLAAIRFSLSSMDALWASGALLGALMTHAALLYWAARRLVFESKR